jgi:hypothetical protein
LELAALDSGVTRRADAVPVHVEARAFLEQHRGDRIAKLRGRTVRVNVARIADGAALPVTYRTEAAEVAAVEVVLQDADLLRGHDGAAGRDEHLRVSGSRHDGQGQESK